MEAPYMEANLWRFGEEAIQAIVQIRFNKNVARRSLFDNPSFIPRSVRMAPSPAGFEILIPSPVRTYAIATILETLQILRTQFGTAIRNEEEFIQFSTREGSLGRALLSNTLSLTDDFDYSLTLFYPTREKVAVERPTTNLYYCQYLSSYVLSPNPICAEPYHLLLPQQSRAPPYREYTWPKKSNTRYVLSITTNDLGQLPHSITSWSLNDGSECAATVETPYQINRGSVAWRQSALAAVKTSNQLMNGSVLQTQHSSALTNYEYHNLTSYSWSSVVKTPEKPMAASNEPSHSKKCSRYEYSEYASRSSVLQTVEIPNHMNNRYVAPTQTVKTQHSSSDCKFYQYAWPTVLKTPKNGLVAPIEPNKLEQTPPSKVWSRSRQESSDYSWKPSATQHQSVLPHGEFYKYTWPSVPKTPDEGLVERKPDNLAQSPSSNKWVSHGTEYALRPSILRKVDNATVAPINTENSQLSCWQGFDYSKCSAPATIMTRHQMHKGFVESIRPDTLVQTQPPTLSPRAIVKTTKGLVAPIKSDNHEQSRFSSCGYTWKLLPGVQAPIKPRKLVKTQPSSVSTDADYSQYSWPSVPNTPHRGLVEKQKQSSWPSVPKTPHKGLVEKEKQSSWPSVPKTPNKGLVGKENFEDSLFSRIWSRNKGCQESCGQATGESPNQVDKGPVESIKSDDLVQTPYIWPSMMKSSESPCSSIWSYHDGSDDSWPSTSSTVGTTNKVNKGSIESVRPDELVHVPYSWLSLVKACDKNLESSSKTSIWSRNEDTRQNESRSSSLRIQMNKGAVARFETDKLMESQHSNVSWPTVEKSLLNQPDNIGQSTRPSIMPYYNSYCPWQSSATATVETTNKCSTAPASFDSQFSWPTIAKTPNKIKAEVIESDEVSSSSASESSGYSFQSWRPRQSSLCLKGGAPTNPENVDDTSLSSTPSSSSTTTESSESYDEKALDDIQPNKVGFTGNVANVLSYRCLLGDQLSLCTFVVLGYCVSVGNGTLHSQKLIMIADYMGPQLEVLYHSSASVVAIEEQYKGRFLRIQGRMYSTNYMFAVSLRIANKLDEKNIGELNKISASMMLADDKQEGTGSS